MRSHPSSLTDKYFVDVWHPKNTSLAFFIWPPGFRCFDGIFKVVPRSLIKLKLSEYLLSEMASVPELTQSLYEPI